MILKHDKVPQKVFLNLKYLKMLDHLTKSDSARVRANRNPKFGGHQVDREHLIHAAHAGRINLFLS
jgi:hypothetical protein